MNEWTIKKPKFNGDQNLRSIINVNFNSDLVNSTQIYSQNYDIGFYVDKTCINEEKYTFLKNRYIYIYISNEFYTFPISKN